MTMPSILLQWEHQLGILSHHSANLPQPWCPSTQALAPSHAVQTISQKSHLRTPIH